MKQLCLKFLPSVSLIAKEAGTKILSYYKTELSTPAIKADLSPVTLADKISNDYLVAALKDLSSFPVLSEEEVVDYSVRKDWKTFWMIDPLDGTKDFLAENDEFCINIALINDCKPILGVIYAPALQELYYAVRGHGAYLEKGGQVTRLQPSQSNISVVAISRFHESEETFSFLNLNNFQNVRKVDSALKFCYLARGEVDVYPRFAGSSEWDISAAEVILNEVDASLIDLSTLKSPNYNKEITRNNFFIAYSKKFSITSFKFQNLLKSRLY